MREFLLYSGFWVMFSSIIIFIVIPLIHAMLVYLYTYITEKDESDVDSVAEKRIVNFFINTLFNKIIGEGDYDVPTIPLRIIFIIASFFWYVWIGGWLGITTVRFLRKLYQGK
tara:strand:- start:9315 stop:9653 length:339 start_codon:yes stop_codon:yes gene_type:complete